MTVNANTVTVRLAVGGALDHNRAYTLKINGLADIQNNLPLNSSALVSGVYTNTFVSTDTLVPQNLRLVRTSDNQDVIPAMTLTRGRTYHFETSGLDNYDENTALNYEIRRSVNAGLSFAAPEPIAGVKGKLPIFNHAVQESDGNLVFQLKVTDANGNYTVKRFDVAVIDPTIMVAPVATSPSPVEELSRADILFNIQGDVDLIKQADIRVFDKWYPVSLQAISETETQVVLSYLHPRLADIAPSTQIPVRLQVAYGFTGLSIVDDSYTLVLDATPPTISIASPGDGERIAINEPTDVLIQSFDRYGIDRVEVQQNADGYQVLDNPNKFTFTATTFDPVTIEARAWDPNGNVSAPISVTLQPFDVSAGEPALQLLAPDNGSVFHGGEDINLEVVMRQLGSADIYFDVGGVESATPVSTMARLPEQPERFPYTVTLPTVAQDSVVVVRAQSGALAARLYLNVLLDSGIESDAVLTAVPSARVMTGSELWLEAKSPQGMDDFADSSELTIEDPSTGPVTDRFAMNIGPRYVNITGAVGDVVLNAVLRDRSKNERVLAKTLTKVPYLGDAVTTVYTPVSSDYVTEHLIAVPGLKDGADDIAWVVNRRTGGYEIRDSAGVISSQAAGQIDALYFTGTGLLAQENRAGNTFLLYIPLENGIFGAVQQIQIHGRVLGGSGELFYMQHGQLLDGYHYVAGEFLPVTGQVVNETVLATQVESQYLYLLTESGLSRYHLVESQQLELQRAFFTAIADQAGFHVAADRVVFWQDKQAVRYQMAVDGTLTQEAVMDAQGQVKHALADGEYWWLLSDGPYANNSWQAWQDNELIGLRSQQLQQILFSGSGLYEVLSGQQSGVIQRRTLVAQASVNTLTPVLTEMPFGVMISNISPATSSGGEGVEFRTTTNLLLAAQAMQNNGNQAWYLPRRTLVGPDIQLVRRDRAGTVDRVTLTHANAPLTLTAAIAPLPASILTQGAQVPVQLQLDPTARVSSQAIDIAGNVSVAANIPAASSYRWVSVPATGVDFSFTQQVDGLAENLLSYSLQANDAGLDSVIIARPVNNQAFTEGQELTIKYQASTNTAEVLRYVEISLFDFNNQLLARRHTANANGQLSFRLPAVIEQENLNLRVRAYYGDTFRYSEQQIGVRVYPELKVPALQIAGVSPEAISVQSSISGLSPAYRQR